MTRTNERTDELWSGQNDGHMYSSRREPGAIQRDKIEHLENRIQYWTEQDDLEHVATLQQQLAEVRQQLAEITGETEGETETETEILTASELEAAWPTYWATHDISDTELERIASMSSSVEQAQQIWAERTEWRDADRQETV